MKTENRLREKLKIVIAAYTEGDVGKAADAILASPEIRVELAEPRYYVDGINPGYGVFDRQQNLLLAEFVNGGARQQRAAEYCDFLNSKEKGAS